MTRTRTSRAMVVAAAAATFALAASLLPAAAGAGVTTATVAAPDRPTRETPDQDEPGTSRELRLQRYGELRFVVDSGVVPTQATTAPLDGTRQERPVGAVSFPEGGTSQVVLDEVVLHARTPEERDGFLARWSGTILQSDPADEHGQELLVRVDPTTADVAGLPENLLSFEPEHVGEHRMSSERLLQLWALVAEESAAGLEVSVNVLSDGETIASGFVTESPDLSPNVFDWSYMRAGGNQDIGVAPAWQLLQAYGRLSTKVNLMVRDHGFVQSDEWPIATIRKTSWGTPNPSSCTNGTSCPWHGSTVVETFMGTANNGFGGAGPAGPLNAEVVVVGGASDAWTIYRELQDMVETYKPEVVNMSFTTAFYSFKWASEQAANRRYKKMNAAGALLVASAGNNGISVDDDVLRVPCESWRVMCVGGLTPNSITRSSGSNYGVADSQTSVEIYGPMCVATLADPSNPTAQGIGTACGTSMASPFVAGVAAMVVAANPTMTHSQIRALVNETAHWGGLGAEVTGSQRRVDAMEAVAKALNVKLVAPKVVIASPKHNSKHSVTTHFEFAATATDYRSYEIPVTWSSSIDGPIGGPTTDPLFGHLSVGKHVISATATDFNGKTTTAKVTVDVTDSPPTVAMVSPVSNKTYASGSAIDLIGTSHDPDTYGPVADTEVVWTVRRAGVKIFESTGHDVDLPAGKVSSGDHTAEFRAIGGNAVTRSFKVVAPPAGSSAPTATIVKPTDGAVIFAPSPNKPAKLTLEGTATDPDDGTVPGTRYRWTAYSAKSTKVLCVGSSVPGQGNGGLQLYKDCSTVESALNLEPGPTSETVWTVQLEVFDSDNVPDVDTAKVTVRFVAG